MDSIQSSTTGDSFEKMHTSSNQENMKTEVNFAAVDDNDNTVPQKRPRLQSLPLPSAHQFLREKAPKVEEVDGREGEQNEGGRGQGEQETAPAADGRANRRSSTASQMLATSPTATIMKEEVISVSSDTEDESDESDDTEAEELSLDKLVHTKELLDQVCLSYDQVKAIVQYPVPMDCVPGCFVKCRTSRSTNETVIDEITIVNSLGIKFKHSRHPVLLEELCNLDGQISTEAFTKWIEDMTRWDEPLPSILACERQNRRVLRALQKAKLFDPEQQSFIPTRQNEKKLNKRQRKRKRRAANNKRKDKQQFKQVFGKKTRLIMVNPRQLVQLHQLDEPEFTRIVTGLFVRVRHWVDNSETLSLEQIRTVSFDHLPPYTMYGHFLTVRLHFVRPAAVPVPILNVHFNNKKIDQQLVEQHVNMIGHFVQPSPNFIQWKKGQLHGALSKTPNVAGKANPKQ